MYCVGLTQPSFLWVGGEKLLETSMSGTEPVSEGSANGQVTSPIRQVGKASVMTYLRKQKPWEVLSLLPRGGGVAARAHPGGDLPEAETAWPGPS